MKKGYILNLGAGENQVPFLEACDKFGYPVISIDKNESSPGFHLSKIKVIESIHEYRKIYNSLLKILLDAPIVGVGCRSYGKAVISASYLAEKFEVPGNSNSIIKKFYNKALLKKFLSENGISIPPQFLLEEITSANPGSIEFPLIAKPINSEAKKGIELIPNEKILSQFIRRQKSKYYFEEFIDGPEFTVLGFVQNNQFQLVSVTDKYTTSYPPFLEIAHVIPTSYPEFIGEIILYCKRIAQVTGLENGPMVAEFKANKLGQLFLIEVMPEIGGEYLAEKLLNSYSGYNYFEDYLKLILGEKIQLFDRNKKRKFKSVIQFIVPEEGKNIFKGFQNRGDYERSIKIYFDKILKKENEYVDPSFGNSSRVRVVGYTIKNEFWDKNKLPALPWEGIFEKQS
ncbi:MAG: ATP-grasp domain-containing protein [Leptospiraceae bacterium]|nr:ATP-grasp domain-containing protein [Leptospiraceae bacterium]MCP5511951.1 ATP-grasp domain-containing protein [Leptospiraceae bacterium]